MMLVLGLDPGLAITGYGLVAGAGQELTLVAQGVLRTPAGKPLAERLLQLHRALAALIARYRPDAAAVEELFFGTNARTAMTVGEARGVLLLALAEAGVPIHGYTPLQVKQAVAGYGAAPKQQVQEMVQALLGLAQTPQPDDAADALAVAICLAHARRPAA